MNRRQSSSIFCDAWSSSSASVGRAAAPGVAGVVNTSSTSFPASGDVIVMSYPRSHRPNRRADASCGMMPG